MVNSQKNLSFVFVIIAIILASIFGLSSRDISQLLSLLNTEFRGSVLDGKTEQGEEIFLVTRVVDGDTIEINDKVILRYIGVDTPEIVDPRKEIQCFGAEATDANKNLVLGKRVSLEKDVSEIDRYGRLLRYVYVQGQMINEQLVARGYAQARSYPPDVKHQDQLRNAESKAREKNMGLWGRCGSKP